MLEIFKLFRYKQGFICLTTLIPDLHCLGEEFRNVFYSDHFLLFSFFSVSISPSALISFTLCTPVHVSTYAHKLTTLCYQSPNRCFMYLSTKLDKVVHTCLSKRLHGVNLCVRLWHKSSGFPKFQRAFLFLSPFFVCMKCQQASFTFYSCG